MAIIEDENNEQPINEMIEEVERDDIPTNVFDVAETDPMVLMGKINKIVLILKQLQDIINSVDFEHLDEQLTEIQNTIDGLSEVATSGDYDDLSNKPNLNTKLDKITSTSSYVRAYSVDESGSQVMTTLATSAQPATIPRRDAYGRIGVGNPSQDGDATNKKYVDDKIADNMFSGDYDDLTNKPTLDFVEKSNTTKQIYGTDNMGNQTTYTISQSANASSIAQRASGGRLDVGTPTSDANATNKKYVDDEIANNMFSGDYNDLSNKPIVDNTPTQNSTNLITSGGVFSNKLGKPQNNYTTNKLQLHVNYNQGDAIWSASEIDRACIVYIRGSFGATNTFRVVSPNNQYIYCDLPQGQNSIVFLCQAGDKIEWFLKDNVYWCDTTKVNFGGAVI